HGGGGGVGAAVARVDGAGGVEAHDGGEAAPRGLGAQREGDRRVRGRGRVHLGREGRTLRGKRGVLPRAHGGRLALRASGAGESEKGGGREDQGNRALHEFL